MAKGEITAQEGSFPLTRGKRGLVQILSSPRRLIPAHAGKTMPPTASLEAHRAHPRSRGENVGDFASGPGGQGSSPLTRGKRHFQALNNLSLRLIPAHAGKTARADRGFQSPAAHPRSRGENFLSLKVVTFQEGSSPLTRGKLPLTLARASFIGLIPAHAGKTRFTVVGHFLTPAHPRSRGENSYVTGPDNLCSGSSPLTRGKLLERGRNPARAGLIPAHAGKTRGRQRGHLQVGAHPRSRGENIPEV